MQRLIIVGAGSLGREVAVYASQCPDFQVPVLFLDDTGARPDIAGLSLPQPEPIEHWQPSQGDRVIVALGDPENRLSLAQRLHDLGALFAPPLVHPLAWPAPGIQPGPGCVIAPFVTIGTGASLGAHVLANTHAAIGHDARVGDGSTLGPHSVLNGWVETGRCVLIGSGAVVTARCQIGNHGRVAAGSVVYTHVGPGLTASGNPARAFPMPAAVGK
ncbi:MULTISPECIES: acetyltransferase [unclassified Haematospirillum]|uniref:acetyltransferase n=1 Tax=unclassified Haematospirillum TaxID=2622088 RepID=UPI00143B20B8|nr:MULTISPECIES: acetyltransferase [unclassified Haematospirillum]NKD55321.1 acetyltransferase [Haematospirillum sp. H4890]NKD75540.1 acetyltransferase [Haematospirillum sp. H4485]NKD88376.1 acetyltransferase [Haematospirillum sp. 15-248]